MTINKTMTGFDCTLLVDGVIVGRSDNFTIKISQAIEEIYEQGTRKAVELKEKKFSVTGDIGGYYINNSLVIKALGGASFTEVLPYFTIQGYLENPEDASVKAVTVQFVKFDSFDLTIPLDSKVEQKLAYKALNVVFS